MRHVYNSDALWVDMHDNRLVLKNSSIWKVMNVHVVTEKPLGESVVLMGIVVYYYIWHIPTNFDLQIYRYSGNSVHICCIISNLSILTVKMKNIFVPSNMQYPYGE